MSRETTYRCGGPGCDTHVRTASEPPVAGFLVVLERTPSEPVTERDFCSWDCIMRFAATLEPIETVVPGVA